MFVIAKVNVTEIRHFPQVRTARVSCVCDDGLMGEGSENRSFNTASPWGDGELEISGGKDLQEREELYLIFSRGKGAIVPEAFAGCSIRCYAITDFGGTSKRVEWCHSDRHERSGLLKGDVLPGHTEVTRFNLKMSIDNPAASVTFEAGSDDGWLHVFRCAEISMDDALMAMHRAFVDEPAEVGAIE